MISLVLVVCMLIPICLTVHATGENVNSFESEVADRIEQIVSVSYSAFPGEYEVKDSFALYNADTTCIYYIIPIFRDQECVGRVELDVSGNVTLTDDTTLYTEIAKLPSAAYLLYTTGGIVYAEFPEEVIELYDSGFELPINEEFTSLSYADKVEATEVCLETVTSGFDFSAVIEEIELICTFDTVQARVAIEPIVESQTCAITDFVKQNGYNICWAACVATIANFKNGSSLTAEGVATAMGQNYTSSTYLGANTETTIAALSLYGLTDNNISGKTVWTNLKNNIKNDRPFIIFIFSANKANGHALTGYGYSCHTGDDDLYANSRYVYVWDPNGYKLTFQYNATSYSLNGYSWKWTNTIMD